MRESLKRSREDQPRDCPRPQMKRAQKTLREAIELLASKNGRCIDNKSLMGTPLVKRYCKTHLVTVLSTFYHTCYDIAPIFQKIFPCDSLNLKRSLKDAILRDNKE